MFQESLKNGSHTSCRNKNEDILLKECSTGEFKVTCRSRGTLPINRRMPRDGGFSAALRLEMLCLANDHTAPELRTVLGETRGYTCRYTILSKSIPRQD